MNVIQIPLYGGKAAIISVRALPLIEGMRWYVSVNGYVVTSRGQYLHRIVTSAMPGQHVDHINFDRLDNRDENLRLTSQAKNNRHVRQRSHSKQPYKGVRARKRGTFSARILVNSHEIYLGTFPTAEAAAAAYDQAASFHFGEYAHLNSGATP